MDDEAMEAELDAPDEPREGEPECSCPDDPDAPADPSCFYHGDDEPPGPGNDDAAQGGGPHGEDPEGAIQEERSREPGGPPPMPTPPEHDTGCDPAALEIHPDLGWVCMDCAMVLGGDQEHATVQPGEEPGVAPPQPAGQEPGAALAKADPIGAAIRVLDPTMIQGPQEFAEQLLYMVARLSQAEYAQRGATHEVVEAKIAYERAYDLAIAERKGQGSADVRAAEARIQCAELLNTWDRAKAVLEAIKGAAHSWRSMISGYQSAARLVGDAYGVQGRYGS